MRRIERTNAFRRDFRREIRGRHRHELEAVLTFSIALLADDKPLPDKNRDHALGGKWHDDRECHLKPDLLLIASRIRTFCNSSVWARTASSSVSEGRSLISRFSPA